MTLKLIDAFRILPGSSVAIIGAGGKTSAMFLMARQFPASVISTSTHLLGNQGSLADRHIILDPRANVLDLDLNQQAGLTLFTGALDEEKFRFLPPSERQLEDLQALAKSKKLPFFIEADGARHRSIKAPGDHEPAIPSFVDAVVLVAGLSVFGKPLSEKVAHRPEVFAALGKINLGDPITPESYVNVANHPLGGLKNMPPNAKRYLLLTQPNNTTAVETGKRVAEGSLGVWDAIAIASTKDSAGNVLFTRKMVSGIVLAAGLSIRYGKPKIYEMFQGVTFLRTVCETAVNSCDEVIVVVGRSDERAEKELTGLPVGLVYNEKPEDGQSGSIKLGLKHISPRSGGALFLHADQPQTSPMLLKALLEEGAKTKKSIIAPMIDGERGTPVYFDSTTYPDLLQISGDQGGKQIFHKYSLHYIPWLDRTQLIDVDLPTDLERLNHGDK